MWVFDDAEIVATARDEVSRLVERARDVDGAPPGIERHGRMAALLVEAGMLAQGLADAGDAGDGGAVDAAAAALRVATGIAAAFDASFRTRGGAAAPAVGRGLAELARGAPDAPVRLRVPEGFAFYALYPELYAEAARAFRRAHGDHAIVIGIRSIGTTLAPVVAASLAPPRHVLSVRPRGDPFAREVALPRATARAIARDRAPVLVVDEGPGLSGSSFASVAAALERGGVDARRLHFLPAHDGPLGPRAGPAAVSRGRATPKHVASFDAVIPADRAPWPLASWFAPALGTADGPLEALGGGAWRARAFDDRREYPPANVLLERRKYLLRTRGGRYLLKFAGIGPRADAHAARAARLSATGLVPRVVARAHGFLATEWRDGRSLAAGPDLPTDVLAAAVAAYIAALASQPVGAGPGAAPETLLRMARRNVELGLGAEHAAALGALACELPPVRDHARPIAVDARMHRWEWLVTPAGALLKTDAFDHHAGHDLVGHQDVAWDVAGALVELAPTGATRGAVLDAAARRGVRVPPRVLRFYETTYLAFQLGAATLAAEMLVACAPDDAARFRAAAATYAAALERRLHAGDAG